MKALLVAAAVLATFAASGSQAATVEERLTALNNLVADLKQEVAQLRSAVSVLARDASGNLTFTVMGSRNDLVNLHASTSVGASSSVSIGADSSTAIGKSSVTQIGQSRSVQIGNNDLLKTIGSHTTNVGSNQTQTVGGSRSTAITKDDLLQVSGNVSHQIGSNLGIAVGKAIIIDAGDQITLKTGDSSIIMKKNGDIAITGKNIEVKGSADVVIKGSKVLTN